MKKHHKASVQQDMYQYNPIQPITQVARWWPSARRGRQQVQRLGAETLYTVEAGAHHKAIQVPQGVVVDPLLHGTPSAQAPTSTQQRNAKIIKIWKKMQNIAK